MNHKELLALIDEVVPNCHCPNAGDHIYKLAVNVLERQKADDAALAEQHSAEAAEAIRST